MGVHLTITSRSSATSNPFFGGIYWDGITTLPPVTKMDMLESRNAIVKHGSVDRNIFIKKYISMAKLFGRSRMTVNGEKDYAAGVGADPVTCGQIIMFGQAENESTSVDLVFDIVLDYFTEFNNPYPVSSS